MKIFQDLFLKFWGGAFHLESQSFHVFADHAAIV